MITDLALILGVASVVILLFKWLRQPLVLGYIVAGFLVSPHMPYLTSVTSVANVNAWASVGVMFLMFTLGLEFSFKKIVKMGMTPVIAAVATVFSMVTLGIIVGHSFGWSRMDSIFLGGMLSMSSTTIIFKAFGDLGLRQQKFASLVMSVLVLEDVLAIVMMVLLSSLAEEGNIGGATLFNSIFHIVFFIILWFVVGLFLIPWILRMTRRLMTDETLLIVALGLCCIMAMAAKQVGFSEAFGAFVMGSILAETVEAEKIEKLVEPVKNLFGAIFFVSVGMLVEVDIMVEYKWEILALVLTIIIGQAVLGTLSYMLSGQSLKTAMRCGFSMAQIGEFAFIIAALGTSLGVTSKFLYPVVVAVSVITTFITPYMIRAAEPAFNLTEKIFPKVWMRRLEHLGTLYDHPEDNDKSQWNRLLKQMALNTLIYSIIVGAIIALMFTYALPLCRTLLPHWWANGVCGVATVMVISPFLRAMMVKKNHSEEFRKLWVQKPINRLPLTFTILVRVVIAMAFLFYITNYLARFREALVLCLALGAIIIMVWSRRLKKHSLMIERMFIQNLHAREMAENAGSGKYSPRYKGRLIDYSLHISDINIPAESLWAGKTLASLSIAKRFGVHVVSIIRGNHQINIPGGSTIVFPLDKLHVIGSDDQLKALNDAVEAELMAEDSASEKKEMQLRKMILDAKSPLVGKPLRESRLREDHNLMLVGIEEGQKHLTRVNPNHVFQVGDVLWVVG